MKTSGTSLFGRLCCGLSMAALTLALSFNGAVRAEDAEVLTPSLQEMIVAPIMRTVQGLEERLASLEASVNAFAASVTSVPQMLCVADDSGARTCITKAQLDSLLSRVAHAEINPPSVTVTQADAPQPAEPVEVVMTTEPAPSAPTDAGTANLLPDQEPEHTGSVKSASSGAAIVWYPEVEISEAPADSSDE